MISRLADTAVARSGRELAEQLSSRHFRAALGISILLHAFVLLGGWDAGGFDPRFASMRVHILQPQVVPADAAPAEAAAPPVSGPTTRALPTAARSPAVARSAPPAASAAEGIPAPDFAVSTGPSATHEPAAPLEETAARVEPGSPDAAEGNPPAPPAETLSAAALAEPPAMPGDGAAVVGAISGGFPDAEAPTRAEVAGDGGSAGAAASAGASAAGPLAAPAPAAGLTGPGRQDLAAIRQRIDSRKRYPPMAVRNGWEGRVLVEMHLDDDGRLAAVRLLQGSGYAVLDEATIDAVRLASPFPPVARTVTVPVEYRLVP